MPRLIRDRLTLLTYGHLVVYGYFLYAFGPMVPLLRDDLGLSRTVSGLHGTALAFGAVLAGLGSAKLVRRVGRGATLRIGLCGLAVGVLLLVTGPTVAATLTGALIAGTSGSIVINAYVAVLIDHHGPAGPAAISEANALAAAAGLLAPLVLGGAVVIGLGWRAGLLVVVVLCALVLVAGTRVTVPRGPMRDAAVPEARLPRHYWTTWTVLVLCISVEFSMTFWASDLLRQRVGLSAGAAAGCVAALVTGMTIGRGAGGRLALNHSTDWLLLRAVGLTGLGFVVFWTSTALWLSLAGLLIMGLGISVQYPLGISRALHAAPGQPDRASARASLGAGLAIGLAPFLLGFLADAIGTHRAFLLVPVLLTLAAAVLVSDRKAGTPAVVRD